MFEVSENSIIGYYAQQRVRSRAVKITIGVLQFLAATIFLIAGATKHAGTIDLANFEKLGMNQSFLYFIGGLQMIGAILIIAPRTAALAAGILAATMIATIVAHLFIFGLPPISTVVLLVVTAAVAWYRGIYE